MLSRKARCPLNNAAKGILNRVQSFQVIFGKLFKSELQ